MTTAELRKMARQAELECRWRDAADLWEQAIGAYIHNGGALAKRDIENMRNKAAAARYAAGWSK